MRPERVLALIGLDGSKVLSLAGKEPDDWQARALRSKADRVLLGVTRQGGKSLVAVAKSLRTAMMKPESLTVLVSPTLRQSTELLRRARMLYTDLGEPISLRSDSRTELELSNRSRIISLPGSDDSTIRGYTPDLLICDEASRLQDFIWDATLPMMAVSHGDVVLLSTPWGKRGFFWNEWSRGVEWERYEVKAEEISRISPEFLRRARASMTARRYAQEFEVSFLGAEDAVFTYEDVMAALDESIPALGSGVAEGKWVIGADLAKRKDYGTLVAIEVGTDVLKVRHVERVEVGTSYEAFGKRTQGLMNRLGGHAVLVADRTGVGDAVAEIWGRLGLKPCWVWQTSGKMEHIAQEWFSVPKVNLVDGVQVRLQKRTLKISDMADRDRSLTDEMVAYRSEVTRSLKETFDSDTQPTDLVSALMLAVWGVGKTEIGYQYPGGHAPAAARVDGAVQRMVKSWRPN